MIRFGRPLQDRLRAAATRTRSRVTRSRSGPLKRVGVDLDEPSVPVRVLPTGSHDGNGRQVVQDGQLGRVGSGLVGPDGECATPQRLCGRGVLGEREPGADLVASSSCVQAGERPVDRVLDGGHPFITRWACATATNRRRRGGGSPGRRPDRVEPGAARRSASSRARRAESRSWSGSGWCAAATQPSVLRRVQMSRRRARRTPRPAVSGRQRQDGATRCASPGTGRRRRAGRAACRCRSSRSRHR